jgi:hypothetical protein
MMVTATNMKMCKITSVLVDVPELYRICSQMRSILSTKRMCSVSRRQVSNGAEATANMGEPSEREALLTILLDIPARECFVVISLWGVK